MLDSRELKKYGLDDKKKLAEVRNYWQSVSYYIEFCKEWERVKESLKNKRR